MSTSMLLICRLEHGQPAPRVPHGRGFQCAVCERRVVVSAGNLPRARAGATITCNDCGFKLASRLRDLGAGMEAEMTDIARGQLKQEFRNVDPLDLATDPILRARAHTSANTSGPNEPESPQGRQQEKNEGKR